MTMLLIINFFPFIKEIMSLSWRTPWGVITSIFIHRDIEHFLLNFQAIVTFLLFYILLNILNKGIKIEYLPFYFCPLLSAILANLCSLLMFPEYTSLGASGVSSAMESYDFALALTYLIANFKGKEDSAYINKYANLFNAFIIFYIFLDILFSPSYSRNPNYNAFVHWVSFFVNFIIVTIIFSEELLIHFLFFCTSIIIFLLRYVTRCTILIESTRYHPRFK
ncbi:MAG: rhomboid family intramembrane serine protease [Nitrososphaeria archaeon]